MVLVKTDVASWKVYDILQFKDTYTTHFDV